MRFLFSCFLFLLFVTTESLAQTDTLPKHRFYAGLQGGYLLKNSSVHKNPLYYLSNGIYAEIMGGWRQQQFGWELALGNLSIKRDASQFNAYKALANDVLDAQAGNTMYKNARDSGQIGDAIFRFPQGGQKQSENFKGWYILTGPVYWFNNKKWQFQINLKGGIISREFGYYLLNGKGISPDSITISYNAATTAAKTATLGKATVTPNGSYVQYGMSRSLWESIQAQKITAGINEKPGIQFIARAGAQAEYFIAKNVSINAAAQYWLIPSPAMTGMDTLGGVVNATLRTNARPTTPTKTSYRLSLKQTYNHEKSLGFLSASLGIRFWLGSSKNSSSRRILPPDTAPGFSPKNLSIQATDSNNKPVAEVTIKIYKEGEPDYTETITHDNGYAPLVEQLKPGNYIITGFKGSTPTNEVKLTAEHFKSAEKAITITLTLQP